MSFNFREKLQSPAIKQAIVVLVTIVALFPAVTSLILSVNQPQVQSNLQLYQIDLNLQASETPATLDGGDPDDFRSLQASLLGEDPLATAEKQYETTLATARKSLEKLQKTENRRSIVRRRGDPLYDQINFVQEVELKLGTIEAELGKTEEAEKIWRKIIDNADKELYKPSTVKSALLLEGLYDDPPRVLPNAAKRIERNFRGWFRDTALERLYSSENRPEALEALRQERGERAIKALQTLLLISLLPILCALVGIALLIALLVQFFLRKDRSLLYLGENQAWETPWDAYTIWLVLVVGFFFAGQIVLPVLFGGLWALLSIDAGSFSLSYKAIYIVISYLALTIAGLSVLYLALAPFRPLPNGWFRFRWWGRWPLWGIGGYFVALPLVIVVSLINQRLWQGQGGSNPLLTLALESRDTVALVCFAFTATIAAPFFEEILFRGFLLPSLTRYFPVWGAIGLSSLVFALAHQSLSEVLPLTVLGCVLGFVYTRSKNLLSSMLIHGLWNGGTLLSLYLLGSSAG
ncbi:type II CAAX endopeptidase family protein [Pannus brasiliensis CCIBt3594]|uniref:Type II CAAX endopeptidase family protein n=1 Tax=Pannus brasiliensis CCIBt3594 TaxID=1427578 RepID=A0AAW9QVH3_9CHRO